jgi:hypothetical protein
LHSQPVSGFWPERNRLQAEAQATQAASLQNPKFFGSFFQKRTAFFPAKA